MIMHEAKKRPANWYECRSRVERRWTIPFVCFEWTSQWIAYHLSNWSFLEVLEYMSSFSVLVAVVFYYNDAGSRAMQKHYQAWQVINTAQGKGGSGGRIDALEELNADKVPLIGVDVSTAYLQGLKLERANLSRSNFSATDLRNSDLLSADFTDADLHYANFRGSNLEGVRFENADMSDVDLCGSNLAGAKFDGTDLGDADIRGANLLNIQWKQLKSVKTANIAGVKNAPQGFVDWAMKNGAIDEIGRDN